MNTAAPSAAEAYRPGRPLIPTPTSRQDIATRPNGFTKPQRFSRTFHSIYLRFPRVFETVGVVLNTSYERGAMATSLPLQPPLEQVGSAPPGPSRVVLRTIPLGRCAPLTGLVARPTLSAKGAEVGGKTPPAWVVSGSHYPGPTGTGAQLGTPAKGRPAFRMDRESAEYLAAPATDPVAPRARIRRCRVPIWCPFSGRWRPQ